MASSKNNHTRPPNGATTDHGAINSHDSSSNSDYVVKGQFAAVSQTAAKRVPLTTPNKASCTCPAVSQTAGLPSGERSLSGVSDTTAPSPTAGAIGRKSCAADNRAHGLSTLHTEISDSLPDWCTSGGSSEATTSRLTLWPGATLAKVAVSESITRPGAVLEDDTERTEYERQGRAAGAKIAGFSVGSRRRVMRKLAMIRIAHLRDNPGLFTTLTYPDSFETSLEDGATWKYHINKLSKRLARAFPDMCFLWRLELIDRKSGAFVGELRPHFHLLMFNLRKDGFRTRKRLNKFRRWLAVAWWEVVGTGDEKHLRAGTSVEVVRSWKQVVSYTAKYVAKVDDRDYTETPLEVGRWWGIVNGAVFYATVCVGEDEAIYLALPRWQAIKLLNYFRYVAGVPPDAGWRLPSLSCFIGADWLRDNVQRLLDAPADSPMAADFVLEYMQ